MDVSIRPPSASRRPPVAYEFGAFRLEPAEQRLISEGKLVPLPHRAFDVLVFLVERSGHLVTKEQLLEGLWPGLFVEESNIAQNVFLLRRALTNGASGHEYIETIPRRGYRFAVPVREIFDEPVRAEPPSPVSEESTPDARPARRRGMRVAALAVVCAGILAAIWLLKTTQAPRPIVGVRSIAVLPLKIMGSAEGADYLGLGLADAVITRLGHLRGLRVRPTASIRSLDGPSQDPVAAGRALRVDAVLAGEVQRSAGHIRVTTQLIGVRDGAELWSEKFDVPAGDLFRIEDAISEAVAEALTSSLSAGETRLVGRDRPTSPEAYETYLKGRFFWNQRTESGTRKARELFEQAIALDPNYAPAYAGLADALHYFPVPGSDPLRPRRLAEKALALDDSLAEAYASLGNSSLFTDWNFAGAERQFRRALDLNPSYATAHQWYAYCFLVRGDLAGASREIRQAREADPLSPSIGVDSGLMLYYAGRYDDAVGEYRKVLELDPAFAQARLALPLALLQKGDAAGARKECPPPAPDPELADGCLALVAARSGDAPEASARLSRVVHSERWWIQATVSAALGDRDGAMAALDKAFQLRSASMLLLGADPVFDGLHADPRFSELMRRVRVRPVERGTPAGRQGP